MEVVLLWLDEIDDLVFTLALSWDRVRKLCLAAGLIAAFTMAAGELAASAALWDAATIWTPRLGAIAGASVGVWFGSGLAMFVRRFYPAST